MVDPTDLVESFKLKLLISDDAKLCACARYVTNIQVLYSQIEETSPLPLIIPYDSCVKWRYGVQWKF